MAPRWQLDKKQNKKTIRFIGAEFESGYRISSERVLITLSVDLKQMLFSWKTLKTKQTTTTQNPLNQNKQNIQGYRLVPNINNVPKPQLKINY